MSESIPPDRMNTSNNKDSDNNIKDIGHKTRGPQVSVIIVNKDGKKYLDDCLTSVTNQSMNRDNYEVLLVDNSSTDGSLEFVEVNFPDVRIIANEENRWYAGGNNDGFAAAKGSIYVILNPDVVVEYDWLKNLVMPLFKKKSIGLTTSKILLHDNKNSLNAYGNFCHYTGLATSRYRGENSQKYTTSESVPAVSGCSFAVRADTIQKIGGFDEDMEFYFEDIDLSWRTHLAGYDITVIPSSVVYHKYKRTLPAWRFYMMERNRILIPIKHLKGRTLLLILPWLGLVEAMMTAYAAYNGPRYIINKLKAWVWIFQHIPLIIKKRKRVQSLRSISDGKLFQNLDFHFPMSQFFNQNLLSRIMSKIFAITFITPYYLVTTFLTSND